MISITSRFDGGNIQVLDVREADDIQLNIRADSGSDFYQWFYYRLQGAAGQACRMRLMNAGGASYPQGWEGYQALASYDRQHWFRVPTRYQDGELVIEHRPQQDSVYYAYFQPYSYERHQDLVARAQRHPACRVESLGRTLDDRELDLLRFCPEDECPEGERDNERESEGGKRPVIWITARQHPGETMAEWFMEGLIEQLLDDSDPFAERLLARADWYLVPNMNPDGGVRGHLRTNAVGVNLNREWQQPSAKYSPEVLHVVYRMMKTGVDLYLDIHGDETLPFNFLAGCAGNPDYSERQAELEDLLQQALLEASGEFQSERGYAPDQFGAETLQLAANQVGQRFGCLAMTLEMPFKDNEHNPDPETGWSAQRSSQLGRDMLQAIDRVLDQDLSR